MTTKKEGEMMEGNILVSLLEKVGAHLWKDSSLADLLKRWEELSHRSIKAITINDWDDLLIVITEMQALHSLIKKRARDAGILEKFESYLDPLPNGRGSVLKSEYFEEVRQMYEEHGAFLYPIEQIPIILSLLFQLTQHTTIRNN